MMTWISAENPCIKINFTIWGVCSGTLSLSGPMCFYKYGQVQIKIKISEICIIFKKSVWGADIFEWYKSLNRNCV